MDGKNKKYSGPLTPFIIASLVFISACGMPYGVYHTVEKGQTLYNIAKVYNVPIEDIERANNIADTAELKSGERLFIPGAEKTMHVPPTVETANNQTVHKPATGQTHTRPANGDNKPQIIRYSTSSVHFIWPLQGKLLQGFNTSNGSRHDGIDIKAPEGTPVKAAAPGTVIYSDDTIRGYGNMIIIRHADGIVTVYAHNSENLVKKGQDVKQGQVISKVGRTGYATTSHLHFEIRVHAIPRNPLVYLPH
jgi:lipoprotein NlpD